MWRHRAARRRPHDDHQRIGPMIAAGDLPPVAQSEPTRIRFDSSNATLIPDYTRSHLHVGTNGGRLVRGDRSIP
jgi:hypothetical protein